MTSIAKNVTVGVECHPPQRIIRSADLRRDMAALLIKNVVEAELSYRALKLPELINAVVLSVRIVNDLTVIKYDGHAIVIVVLITERSHCGLSFFYWLDLGQATFGIVLIIQGGSGAG